jgi:hypothetical protein
VSSAVALTDETVSLMGRTSFNLAVEPDGLAVLAFDTPNEKVNKYSRPVLKELDALLDVLARRGGAP